jgi:putative ABC transport system permease protein
MFGARKLSRAGFSYVVRQGIANLQRPNNRTALLMLSLGLGTFLILTVFIVQHSLLGALEAEGYGKEGDTVLFDVQPDQKPIVSEILQRHGLPLVDEAPIIAMRISSVKGTAVELLLTNKHSGIPRWVLRREYRSSYSDHLRSGEKLIAGKWYDQFTNNAQSIPISVEQSIATDLKVGLGDELVFDVQGIPVKTRVGSIREVDWRRVQPNFFIVFPKGSLEDAPGFFALVTRAGTAEKSAALQRDVVQKFSNVSVIDLRLILQTVDALLAKVSFVLQFMALFTAFTGVLVLVGAVLTGRYQRAREGVLLRTLGASKNQIRSILLIEYISLGAGAAATGTLLSLAASWALAHYVFHIGFVPGFSAALAALIIVPVLTTVVGLLLSRDTVRQPPMAVLRSEAALQ